MTRVEECTKAEIGVGAAIATGSQALKGICALFTIIARIKQRVLVGEFQRELEKILSTAQMRKKSPSLFIIRVIKALFNTFWDL